MAIGGLPEVAADDRVAALLVDPYSFPIAGFLDRCNTTMPGFPLVGGLASGPGGPGRTGCSATARCSTRGRWACCWAGRSRPARW